MVSLVTRMRRTQPGAVRSLRLLFWLACVCVLAGTLSSALTPQIDAPLGDKTLHAGAFYVLGLLGVLAYPKTSAPLVALALVAYGGAIEMLQAIPLFNRQPEWADLLADAIGVCLALAPLSVARGRDMLAALRR